MNEYRLNRLNQCCTQFKKQHLTCRAFGNAQVNTVTEKLTEAACKHHCRPTRSTQKELNDAKKNLDEAYSKALKMKIN